MQQVLDANALMIYLKKGTGYEKIKALFTKAADKDKNLLMTSVSFREVYYAIIKEHDIHRADEVTGIIQNLPIEIVAIDQKLATEAAIFKANYKLSYINCFTAALAKKGELITTDKEFNVLEADKTIKVNWITS